LQIKKGTVASDNGARQPSEYELEAAQTQGLNIK
jgi:hypothetical protein